MWLLALCKLRPGYGLSTEVVNWRQCKVCLHWSWAQGLGEIEIPALNFSDAMRRLCAATRYRGPVGRHGSLLMVAPMQKVRNNSGNLCHSTSMTTPASSCDAGVGCCLCRRPLSVLGAFHLPQLPSSLLSFFDLAASLWCDSWTCHSISSWTLGLLDLPSSKPGHPSFCFSPLSWGNCCPSSASFSTSWLFARVIWAPCKRTCPRADLGYS